MMGSSNQRITVAMTGKLWNGKLITEIVEICLAWVGQLPLSAAPCPLSSTRFCCHCCLALEMTSEAVAQLPTASCQVAAEVKVVVILETAATEAGLNATPSLSLYLYFYPSLSLSVCLAHLGFPHMNLPPAPFVIKDMLGRLITCERTETFATVQQYLLKVHNDMKSWHKWAVLVTNFNVPGIQLTKVRASWPSPCSCPSACCSESFCCGNYFGSWS